MKKNTLFLTLKIFSATGGIEKVCRIVGKVLYENTLINSTGVLVCSMYDHQKDANDNKYFPSEIFRGYKKYRLRFIFTSIRKGFNQDVILLSHINLLLVGWMIKKLKPSVKLVMLAHGIEVWGELGWVKKTMLKSCDLILPVSKYTADKIISGHQFDANNCKVLNNCLDPFMPIGNEFLGNQDVRKKYGYREDDKVIFTLCRLSSKERYKGYDKVIQALAKLKSHQNNIKYLLAGSYDKEEKIFLDELIANLHLENEVKITGFIDDSELVAHFAMADLYIMPSMKEGFGIVFIEAMFYGVPVIAGNKDGSVDALMNGDLGLLVNPEDVDEIENAIQKSLLNNQSRFTERRKMINNFGYEQYKQKLETILLN